MKMIFQEPVASSPLEEPVLPEPEPEPALTQVESAPEFESLVIADPELLTPEGQRWITYDSMCLADKNGQPIPRLSVSEVPRFSVSEASKFFFGNGPDWLRWRMRPDDHKTRGPDGKFLRNDDGSFVMVPGNFPEGFFVLDGIPIQPKRSEAGARYFTLADIERMATALAQNGFMDGTQLTNVMVLVKTCARIYGYIE
jgi:hypothetical protein